MFTGTPTKKYNIIWSMNGQTMSRQFESFEKAAEFAGNLPEEATKVKHEEVK